MISKNENPKGMMSGASRRSFMRTFGALLASGVPIPFAGNISGELGLLGLHAEELPGNPMMDKLGLRVLSDRPWNAETPVTLLDDDITPNARHFVRNNGLVPARALSGSLEDWSLTIDGEVKQALRLSMEDLKTRFDKHKATLVIECGGNGRAGYKPPASGNQWTLGAVGCAKYEGIKLRDLLKESGVKDSAVYLAYESEDLHLSRDPDKTPISRGVPIEKALDEHTMLAWAMNGEPLPAVHGFPLRLICPGWPGSTGGKWLKRLWVRDRVHDGTKMTGKSYRVPRHPVAPGTDVADENMEIIEEMPVKSIITRPGSGYAFNRKETLNLGGHAWSGKGDITQMHISIDFGATWQKADLGAPPNRYAWQKWHALVRFPSEGYYEVWARATDASGRMQPMLVPGWNPKGYLNNAMHRIAVKVS
jgi:DMSO/TMAO reductase YedYZ molybdopterin-dependent catalytic subunit